MGFPQLLHAYTQVYMYVFSQHTCAHTHTAQESALEVGTLPIPPMWKKKTSAKRAKNNLFVQGPRGGNGCDKPFFLLILSHEISDSTPNVSLSTSFSVQHFLVRYSQLTQQQPAAKTLLILTFALKTNNTKIHQGRITNLAEWGISVSAQLSHAISRERVCGQHKIRVDCIVIPI